MYRTVAPVSRSLDISPSANEAVRSKIQDALVALDNIHWCWLWPEHAEVSIADVDYEQHRGVFKDKWGEYQWWPHRIVVANDCPVVELVFYHEVGHHLDYVFLDADCRFASERSSLPAMQRWRQAVQDSPLVQWLADEQKRASPTEQRVYDYLLHPTELWARSYAQYVLEQYGTNEGKRQLDVFRNPIDGPPWHWNSAEFRTIQVAIEDMFGELGWLP